MQSVYRAAKEVGQADMVVARELAGVVTLFLERRHWNTTPRVEDIQDMVERVLLETGHVEVARSYIRERSTWTADPEPPPRSKDTGTLFPESHIAVTSASGEAHAMWDRRRIERALEREAGLPAETAQNVAEAVEAKIVGAGLERISSHVIRSLVDAELFARGFHDRIRGQAVVGVPGYDLKRWIREADHPSRITRQVAERALSAFTFTEVFSREVAAAHAEGRIHVVGAQYPVHLHSMFVALEFVKRFGNRPWDTESSVVPEDPAQLCEAVRDVVGALSGYVLRGVDMGYFNLMSAPFLEGEDPYAWAGSLLGALDSGTGGIPPVAVSVELVGGVPDFLRFTDAVGPGGIRLGRGYGEFWTDAERLTRALVDAGLRQPGGSMPEFNFHIDRNTFRNPSSLSLVRGLCAEIARGLPMTFVFEREGTELRVHTRYLTRVEDSGLFRHPESTRIPYLQMAVVNAAQAAFRAGRGNFEGFTDELEISLKAAFKAFSEKRDFLLRLADRYGGPFRRLTQPAGDGKPVLDLSKGEFLLVVNGFAEAVIFLTGKDLTESGDALDTASKAASFLSLKTREEARQSGLRVAITGPCPPEAARRLHETDKARFPGPTAEFVSGMYGEGLRLLESEPHDLLQRIRTVGNLYSLIEPCIALSGFEDEAVLEPEDLFDLVCEVFERTEMTYLKFEGPPA